MAAAAAAVVIEYVVQSKQAKQDRLYSASSCRHTQFSTVPPASLSTPPSPPPTYPITEQREEKERTSGLLAFFLSFFLSFSLARF